MNILVTLLIFFALAAPISDVLAERADRSKPVNLEADKVSVDDKQHLHTFEGNVKLSQGTLSISTTRLVVQQDAEGFQRGQALGGTDGLAHFKQKREGRSDYIVGEAERIEHDNRTERTEFFGRAMVRSGSDEVRGPYISFDAKTENYVVSGGPDGTPAAAENKGRVRATIQPKERPKTEGAGTKP